MDGVMPAADQLQDLVFLVLQAALPTYDPSLHQKENAAFVQASSELIRLKKKNKRAYI